MPRKRNGTGWILLGLILLGGLGYAAWRHWGPRQQTVTASPVTSQYQTTPVRRGTVSLSASGSGTLVPSQTMNLGFASAGKIGTLNVQVGSQVKAGDLLATLDNTDQLKLNVQNQQLAVQVAVKALDDLRNNSAGAIAQAHATQDAAVATATWAANHVYTKRTPRCDPNLTEKYYFDYLYAQKAAQPWENALGNPNTGYGHDYILQNLNPLKVKIEQAYVNWQYCQGYSAQEIQASQARNQQAQANLQQANNNVQVLQANNGVDPQALQVDQMQVQNAEAQLSKAQLELDNAIIVAPMSGVVTVVNGQAGQASGDGTVITLADVSKPQIQVNMDETDLDNFAVGCAAQVSFNSQPGQNYSGTVTQVNPTLATVNGVSVVQGLINLNPHANASMPPLGSNATATVTCKTAQNVLLAPTQALYQPAGQPAYVYVLNARGQPEKRAVQVGLKTTTFTEIRSGLNQGEQVITSPVKSQG